MTRDHLSLALWLVVVIGAFVAAAVTGEPFPLYVGVAATVSRLYWRGGQRNRC